MKEIRVSCARMPADNALTSASTAAFRVSTVQAIYGIYIAKKL
jgi:hypothetical protein